MGKSNHTVPQQHHKKSNVGNVVLDSKKQSNSIIPLIIAFCVPVLLYLQTVKFGFTCLDDNFIIVDNAAFLSNFKNAPHVFITNAFIVKSLVFYRPLQTLSYMVDILISGVNTTWMFHLTNILLAGFIACSLLLLLKRLSFPPKLALLSTLLYCVHPLFVSSIAWIPARGDLLLTLFSILSFLFLIDYLQQKKVIYLILHWISFIIALFSKETAAFLPLIFLLYYLVFVKDKRFDKELIYTILLYCFAGIIWFWLRSKAVGDYSNADDMYGVAAFLSNLRTIPESLSKFFLPFDVNPLPCFSYFKTIVGVVIIASVIIIFFKSKERSNKDKFFFLIWFLFLMLPPMLFKLRYLDYLDHRFFLPLIGILLFFLYSLPQKWFANGDIKQSWIPITIIVFLCFITIVKARSYSNPITFYDNAISQNAQSVLAYDNRGFIKSKQGDFRGAIADYNKAIGICPTYVKTYSNRAMAKMNIGDIHSAINDLDTAIKIRPNFTDAYIDRGNMRLSIKDYNGAIVDYSEAIKINPKDAKAFCDRGIAKANLSDNIGAIEDYNKAIALYPNYFEAYYNEAIAMGSSANFIEAIHYFTKAIEINPNSKNAYGSRAVVKYNAHDLKGTIEDCEMVLKFDPTDQRAMDIIAKVKQELQESNQ